MKFSKSAKKSRGQYLRLQNLNKMFHSNYTRHQKIGLNSLTTRDLTAEFGNSVDLDEVAYNEPPHLDLHCLPSHLCISQYNIAWT